MKKSHITSLGLDISVPWALKTTQKNSGLNVEA